MKFAHRVTKSKDRDVEWSGRQAEPAVKAIKEPVRRLLSGYIVHRPQSRSLESQMAGLQFLWLARRLKPWLVTIDGL